MASIRMKLIIAGIVLTGAVSYLAMAGMKSGWVYYMDVDKYLADAQYASQRVRLHGKVAEDGFSLNKAGLNATFQLAGHTRSVAVSYHGAIPDMFECGRDVVVEGKMRDGIFQADVLMTKCASKYETQTPHQKDDTQPVEQRT